MFLTRRLTAFAAVSAALAVAAPVGSASATAVPAADPDMGSPSCPQGYSGPVNLATGCPWWLMTPRVVPPAG
jgi:hypothetical protein